jgi:phosphomannomutase
VQVLGGEVFDRYLARVLAARTETDRAPLRIAHTPLHGVGGEPVRRALEAAGYEVHQVASQREPDGTFPTVAFPNPEEPGVLDEVLALATEVDADLVLANDPDVDRLAVAVPDRNGGWLPLDGNQVGILLADHLLTHGADLPKGAPIPTSGDRRSRQRLVVSSIVSTPMAAAIAAAHGARHEVTLTGFKWICNAALDLAETDGARLVLGFEEALGYCVGEVVHDKDGINAAVAFADLAAAGTARGTTVLGYLDELYEAHGRWISAPLSIVRSGPDGPAEIAAAMERIDIDRHPAAVAGRQVESVVDLRGGADQRPRWLPDDAVVELTFDGGRALVRPSGTEPKLKIYVDVRASSEVPTEEALADAARIAHDLATFLGLAQS